MLRAPLGLVGEVLGHLPLESPKCFDELGHPSGQPGGIISANSFSLKSNSDKRPFEDVEGNSDLLADILASS